MLQLLVTHCCWIASAADLLLNSAAGTLAAHKLPVGEHLVPLLILQTGEPPDKQHELRMRAHAVPGLADCYIGRLIVGACDMGSPQQQATPT